MRVRKSASVFLGLLLFAGQLAGQDGKRISAAEAKDHVGEVATVCGQVASAKSASSTRGRPTFLNLDKPYPEQIFTVVIWGDDRPKFGRPEQGRTGSGRTGSGL